MALLDSLHKQRGDGGRDKKSSSKILELVSFSIGSEEYGIEILRVQEIIRLPEIVQLPNSQRYIKGVINLRGIITPILDLREQFGLDTKQIDTNSRAIVVKLENKETKSNHQIGLATDSVSHVIRLNSDDIEPAPPVIKGIAGRYVKGVGKYRNRFIILLDLDQLLTSNELKLLGSVSVGTLPPV